MAMKTLSKVAASLLTMVCLPAAFAQQVALIDSGISSNVNVAPGGFNHFDNNSDTSDVDVNNHGSTSALIISESFSGGIVPFKVTDAARSNIAQSVAAREASLSDIASNGNIRAVGITYGDVVGSPSNNIASVSSAGKFIAIMAGNEGAAEPSALALGSQGLPGVLIVGGTDSAGNLLSQSNRAGSAATRFVTSPGVTQFNSVSGSSFATARITGIAGRVFQQNPQLTGQEVVDIIIASTLDRGATGVDSINGQGFIANAAQVLNHPVGSTLIATGGQVASTSDDGGGGGSSGAGAALLVGGAVAAALIFSRKSKKKLEKTLVLDSYGRGFHIDLNDQITVEDGHLKLSDFFSALGQKAHGQRIGLGGQEVYVDMMYSTNDIEILDIEKHFASPYDKAMQDNDLDMSLSLGAELSNGFNYELSHKVNPDHYYGGMSDIDDAGFNENQFFSGQSFSSPLSGFAHRADAFRVGYAAKDKLNVSMGLVSVDEDQDFGKESLSAIFQGKYQFDNNTAISVQFGKLNEEKSLFGGSAGGAFGVQSSETYALNFTGNWQINDQLALVGHYGVGYTDVQEAELSFLHNFSGIESSWFGMGLLGRELFRKGDKYGLAFSQPLRIDSGEVDYSVPYARDYYGTILKNTERVSLVPEASERMLEGFYATKLGKRFELGTFFTVRENPNHEAASNMDYSIMATLRLAH